MLGYFTPNHFKFLCNFNSSSSTSHVQCKSTIMQHVTIVYSKLLYEWHLEIKQNLYFIYPPTLQTLSIYPDQTYYYALY